VQINASHRSEAVDGLLEAFAALQHIILLPSPDQRAPRAA